jgi:hypothetical protein
VKQKLTLTVERAAIVRAKAAAKRQGISLSRMIEEQFNRLSAGSFTERWYGKFKEPPPNRADPRLTYLRRKYLGTKE